MAQLPGGTLNAAYRSMVYGASAPALATAAAPPRRGPVRTQRLLFALLSVVLIAGGSGCAGVDQLVWKLFCEAGSTDPRCKKPPADCLPTGPALCGPSWDLDNDTISTATEVNTTNASANGGFYTFDVAKWDTNYSQARGVATSGTLYRGMNLTNSWTGYTHYDFCEGNADVDDWGTGHLARLIEATGRLWIGRKASDDPLMQVGDLSLRLGGEFAGQPGVPGCETGHEYHQQGVDVDIRYVRKDGEEGPLDICDQKANYDTAATITLLNSFSLALRSDEANAPIDSIFVDLDCLGAAFPASVLFHKPGHRTHFHVRIHDPDGPFN